MKKRFKIKIDKKIGKEVEVPENILKYTFGPKSLNQQVKVFTILKQRI